jgi:hypothetical protein
VTDPERSRHANRRQGGESDTTSTGTETFDGSLSDGSPTVGDSGDREEPTPRVGGSGDREESPPRVGGPGDREESTPTVADPVAEPSFGDAWVYESIVSALPGANLAGGPAIALQLGVFTAAMVVVAAAYDLWEAVLPGAAAIVVAAVGSYLMLQFASGSREAEAPPRYYRLLYGSSIEVVLAVLAFIALLTHLFVYEPQFVGEASPLLALLPVSAATADEPLVTALFGTEPPVVAVYLTMLVLWDLCYRIGTSWWAAVVSLYRELRVARSAAAAATFRRLDVLNVGFAATQVVLLPFLLDRPVLLLAVGGHILAVAVVSGAAVALSLRSDT